MRYRPELDFVLRNVSFTVQGGHKVGVVGRTGAGKSSLLTALFRLVEVSEGRIVIDGVNISLIGLDDLRNALSIIPQEPTLFSGTVRDNLDPWHEYDDSLLWDVLKRVHLHPAVQRLSLGLDAPVTPGGENFSVGERQLLCLGRALMKKSRVIVLDEATANVDAVTDGLIQQTLKEEFVKCTVITIAHRLLTVIDYDRVLVMSNGEAKEFGSPQELLLRSDSLFSKEVNETGTEAAALLRRLAFEKR
mmetsp:Transcript_40363/g.67447  ORF Transcript_40363/g.67447 Transcript_40363/m.67447 type:complete len:247 (+) Transcript_40363:63-803(+)